MNRHQITLGSAVASLALLILMHPASAATFKWANDGDVRAMDPYTLNETVQNSFLNNIYERLVQRDKQLGIEPALAVSWKQTSATVWRFNLRPNVKWQDGRAFSADDVTFSYQRISGKNSAKRSQVSTIKKVRKIDDLTVDIETDGPDPILPIELSQMDIMSKVWCEEHDAVENVLIGKGESYALRHAMGTGPFRLLSRAPDRKTVVERNPDWWAAPSTISTGRVQRHRQCVDPRRRALIWRDEHDLLGTAAGHGSDRQDGWGPPDSGAGATHDLSRRGPVA